MNRRRIVGLALVAGLFAATHIAAPQDGKKPLTKDEVIELVKNHVPTGEVVHAIEEFGIDFEPSDDFFLAVRAMGASDEVIAALRKAKPNKPPENKEPQPAQIVVQTSPGAEVYLDDSFKGQASPEGRLAIDNPTPGAHTLRVALAGKKNFEQQVTVAAGEPTQVQATLADVAGSIRVRASAGAEVFLDNTSKGTIGASGQLVIPDAAGGAHELRVSAPGKKGYRQSVNVTAGGEADVEATLADVEKPNPSPPVGTPRPAVATLTAGGVRRNPQDGLNYVWIPPGTFQMGCSPGDSECGRDEKPLHPVTISKGFWLGQTPVTAGAYRRFSAATGREMPAAPSFNEGWAIDNMPVVNVTWDDARAYCGWMGGRLPTEAEWEYAARAGSTEARYGPLDEIAWYDQNSGGKTNEVGQKRANSFGLFDMLGNVWEWVNDWYDNRYHPGRPSADPPGPSGGRERVQRGGSWYNQASNERVSFRNGNSPGARNVNIGFRCFGAERSP
jgi:formylglycine-generating enzyme required for sulfatase activity